VAEGPDDPIIDTVMATLTSDALLRRVQARLSVDRDFQALSTAQPASSRTAIDSLRRSLLAALKSLKSAFSPSADSSEDFDRRDTAGVPNLIQLKRALKVNQERHSWVIAVSYTDENAKKAAAIANAVVETHIDNQRERKQEQSGRVLAWVERQIAEVGVAWKQADSAARQYRMLHGTARSNTADIESIADATQQLALARSDYTQRQDALDRVQDLQRRGAGVDAFSEFLGTQSPSEDQSTEAGLSSIGAVSATPPDDPGSNSQRAQKPPPVPRAKTAQIGEAIKQLENETTVAHSRVKTLEDYVATLQSALAAHSDEQTELQALEHRADSAAKLFTDLLQRRQETKEERDFSDPDVRILTPAWKPVRPSSLNALLFIPPALIAFSFFGAILAITLDRLDRSFYSERDVADALGVPCVGLVPEIHRRQLRDYLSTEDRHSTYAQAIRSLLVTALKIADTPRERKFVFVTSSEPGEGRTTLAISLAISATHLGRRVLLVDFGLPTRGEHVGHREMSRDERLKLLLQGASPFDAIRRTDELALDQLAARDIWMDPLGSLASEQAPEFFRRLRNSYDWVIIDGPPVFAMAETCVIASIVDEVIFAIRWGTTRREVVKSSVEFLQRSSAFNWNAGPSINAVLSRVNLATHARYRYGDIGEFLRTYRRYYALPAPDHGSNHLDK
jgi:uncharacterized protein involved in exopolysaccharide biosynthesis/Mrp family chromosome partitioning ATPase